MKYKTALSWFENLESVINQHSQKRGWRLHSVIPDTSCKGLYKILFEITNEESN